MLTPSLRRQLKRILLWVLPTYRSRAIPGLVGRVHQNDAMLFDTSESSIINYQRAADSAIENLTLALSAAGRSFAEVRSCLDFGCGHGRVLRRLQQLILPPRITASDVDEEAVWFCAAEFGVQPLVSSWRLEDLRLGSYDLIWSGSVLTHLDAAGGRILLRHLGHSLRPGGILVFSAHGQASLDGLERLYGGAHAREATAIRQEVSAHGISFRQYGKEFGDFPGTYGMTWHRRDYFEQQIRELFADQITLLLHRPQGWDNHHDVYAFSKR